jgi:hypothetical protein
MGLPSRVSKILSERTIPELNRIEECVNGILDAMIIANIDEFRKGSKSLPVIRRVIRKIITVGVFDLRSVVQQWKEFGTYLLLEKNGKFVTLSVTNIFKCLNGTNLVGFIRQSNEKPNLTSLAHLISSRQLPAGDQKNEKRALRTFISCVTESPVVDKDEEFLTRVRNAAKRIGTRLATHRPKAGSHISLVASASFDYTVKDGGRGKEIVDFITEYLKEIPVEEEVTQSPFGLIRCVPRFERWKTMCRSRRDLHFVRNNVITDIFAPGGPMSKTQEAVLGEKIVDVDTGLPVNAHFGFDGVIGKQILSIAYLQYLKWVREGKPPIPMRLAFVPEPGFKTRVVTTTKWWVNVIQQVPGHMVRDVLANNISAMSGLTKSNQAWSYLYQVQGKVFPSGSSLLCSDLKEATDHIPFSIARALLEGFCEGFDPKDLILINEAIDLVSKPRVFREGEIEHVTQRGCMMGEPMTKSILTLHQLVAEELAFETYVSLPHEILRIYDWRCYNVGGDDIAAIGPKDYLDLITSNLLQMEAKLSPEKHGIYDIVGKYTEKLLYVPSLLKGESITTVFHKYATSAWVESVKIRLISPTTKSTEILNDRNTAIGKAKSLAKELSYLPDAVIPYYTKCFIRDRFLQRMGSLIPDRSCGTFWHMLLPVHFGGLGLWLPGDLEEMAEKLPKISIAALRAYERSDGKDRDLLRDIRRIPLQSNFHGYAMEDSATKRAEDYLDFVLDETRNNILGFSDDPFAIVRSPKGTAMSRLTARVNPFVEEVDMSNIVQTWNFLKRLPEIKDLPDALKVAKLRKAGWYIRQDVVDMLKRPCLFEAILTNKAKPKLFSTVPLKERLGKVWMKYDPKDQNFKNFSITKEELSKIFGLIYTEDFVNVRKLSFLVGYPGQQMLNLVETIDYLTPSLKIGLF